MAEYRPDFAALAAAAIARLERADWSDDEPGTWVDDDHQLRCSDCGSYLDEPECRRCRHTDAAIEARRHGV